MRALKAAVIIMGVMIVAGTILLAVMLANRLSGSTAAPGLVGLGQPEGTRILGIAGVADRLAIHVTGGGLPDRVLLVDPARARLVGTVQPDAPASR